MGRSKAWLKRGDRPLLIHVLQVLTPYRPFVVVAGAQGRCLPSLPNDVGRVDDPPHATDGGPIVGLVAGLKRLSELGVDRAYLTSCDAAYLTFEHAQRMLEGLSDKPHVDALMPVSQVGGRSCRHALASAVRVEPLLGRLNTFFDGGGRRLQAAFEGLELQEIRAEELCDPRVLLPCNTPEQWAEARLKLGT